MQHGNFANSYIHDPHYIYIYNYSIYRDTCTCMVFSWEDVLSEGFPQALLLRIIIFPQNPQQRVKDLSRITIPMSRYSSPVLLSQPCLPSLSWPAMAHLYVGAKGSQLRLWVPVEGVHHKLRRWEGISAHLQGGQFRFTSALAWKPIKTILAAGRSSYQHARQTCTPLCRIFHELILLYI